MAQLHPFTDPVAAVKDPPRVIAAGDGCYVIDEAGTRFLDAASGLWCASLGFSDERLIQAATRQLETLPWYHNFMGRVAEPTERLAKALAEKLPDGFERVFFACTGSEAVDTAVKLARFHQQALGRTSKTRIIARTDGYHGSGATSAALSGMSYMHDGFALPERDVIRAPSHHWRKHRHDGESELDFSERRAAELDALILAEDPSTICAFIGEPAVGSGGAIPPPEGYWAAIGEVLRSHDILLIADEIITGFGRTGRWFGTQTWDMAPQLMTLAKQLSGAYFPISAVAVHHELLGPIDEHAHALGTLGHGFTYGGHPVGAAVALEAIRIYDEMNLESHVATRAAWFAARLRDVAARTDVVEVRQAGLLIGVEVAPSASTERGRDIGRIAEDHGVFFRIIGDTVAISPPFIITNEQVEYLMDTLIIALDATMPERTTP